LSSVLTVAVAIPHRCSGTGQVIQGLPKVLHPRWVGSRPPAQAGAAFATLAVQDSPRA
jgi:hypothetical protein